MRTARLAVLAFVLAFVLVVLSGSMLRFLWVAYQHGGL